MNDLEAELAFHEGRFSAAATSWGKVMAPNPSFEELALKFVGVGSPDALQTYLLTKLDTLAPADKAQVRTSLPHFWQSCYRETHLSVKLMQHDGVTVEWNMLNFNAFCLVALLQTNL